MAIQGSTVVEATLFWPFLTKKNEMAGKFTVDLGKLDKATMKAIKDIGLGERIRTKDDDRGMFVTCKTNFPPKVVDMSGMDVDGSIVGNGTTANVKVQAYDGKYPGLFAGFNIVQVIDMIEYTSGGGGDGETSSDSDMEGFSFNKTTASKAADVSDVNDPFEDD